MKSIQLKRVEAIADLNQIIHRKPEKEDLVCRTAEHSTNTINLHARERSARYSPLEQDVMYTLLHSKKLLKILEEIVTQ